VHSSHVQVLAEIGYAGMAAWCWLFVVSFVLMLRVRSRSRDPRRTPREAAFLFTMSNALMTSMVGFLIGGSFLSLALNDLTWLTFALVAGLDRLSKQVGLVGAPSVEGAAQVPDEQPVASLVPAGPAAWLPRL
jgi:O-antigen ligase